MKPWPSVATAKAFERTFGAGLHGIRLTKYWSPLMGFDLVKFDEEVIKPPDGTSTHDHIKKVYGLEAASLVEGLL